MNRLHCKSIVYFSVNPLAFPRQVTIFLKQETYLKKRHFSNSWSFFFILLCIPIISADIFLIIFFQYLFSLKSRFLYALSIVNRTENYYQSRWSDILSRGPCTLSHYWVLNSTQISSGTCAYDPSIKMLEKCSFPCTA